MKMEEQKLELYQDIIDKILQNADLSVIESDIVKNDTAFHAYQNEFGILTEGIKRAALHKKLEEIKDLENNFSPASANVGKPVKRRKWLFALGILFLLTLVYLVTQLNKGGNYDKDLILANYTVNWPEADVVRGSDSKTKEQAYLHYNNEEYLLAIKAFEALIEKENIPEHKFYLAICLLETKKFKATEKLLEDQSMNGYQELPVNYYLALSKIGTDNPEEAVELLSNPTLPTHILDKNRKKLIRMLTR